MAGKKKGGSKNKLFSRPTSASAPYNFIQLPEEVVPAPYEGADEEEKPEEYYREHVSQKGLHSGCVELKMTTLTPLFIGGGELKQKLSATINPDTGRPDRISVEGFFSPEGQPVIPGSSLRGMMKNLIKIMTCGAMRAEEDFTDRHLYYRDFASQSGEALKQQYIREMQTDGLAEPGFLVHTREGFRIYHALEDSTTVCHMSDEPGFDQKSANIDWKDDGSVLVRTGPMSGKRKYFILHWKDGEAPIPVPDQVIRDYEGDAARRGLNVLEKNSAGHYKWAKEGKDAAAFTSLPEAQMVVPCFYKENENNHEVRHFGNGQLYRIPYHHSVGDRIPVELQLGPVDFAEDLFGKKELWAGRLSFEDAVIADYDPKKEYFLDEAYSQPLMEPKPTSYQLYLEQPKNSRKGTVHWDSAGNVKIRGYKLYWHQDITDGEWKKDPRDGKKIIEGTKQIHPLKRGITFTTRIRFDRLNDVELGALLKVFALRGKHDICFKLGRGKPLGMGSIRIAKPVLRMEDSRKRYTTLFTGSQWEEAFLEQDWKPYVDAFDAYMAQHIPPEQWEERILEPLRVMMDWRNVGSNDEQKSEWKQKTAYMDFNDPYDRYKERVPLKEPVSFVKDPFKG